MKKIIFISDFFNDELIGGTEKNDSVLIDHLRSTYIIEKIKSKDLTESKVNENDFFVVSNFTQMQEHVKQILSTKRYIIYEHDHKYINTRDPSKFTAFKIPKNNIINKEFYKRAHKIFVLSKICKQILEENLNLNNVINIGTSLWSNKDLETLEQILLSDKKNINKASILKSSNPIKGYKEALQICKAKNLKTKVIESKNQKEIWNRLYESEMFVFIPKVLETFSRITCEAKMLECKVLTKPNLIGFFSEEIDCTGLDLIKEIKKRIILALNEFEKQISEMIKPKKTICFVGKFDEIYDEEGKARALEKVGFRVIRHEENKFNNNKLVYLSKPDFLFFTKLRVPNKKELIEECKIKNIQTVCWVPDLYHGISREKELKTNPIFKSDFVFTPDGGNKESFENLKINHYCIRQGISEEYLSTDPIEKEIDILFIGTLGSCHLPYRRNLINFLKKEYGNKFKWYGSKGDREIRNKELNKVYRMSKIVIGDCVDSKSYWSNRIYEVLGRNCLLIHPDVEGMEKEFKIGEDLITFKRNDFSDLKNKIDNFLKNESMREKIAYQGYNKIKNKDLLINRANEIKEIIL